MIGTDAALAEWRFGALLGAILIASPAFASPSDGANESRAPVVGAQYALALSAASRPHAGAVPPPHPPSKTSGALAASKGGKGAPAPVKGAEKKSVAESGTKGATASGAKSVSGSGQTKAPAQTVVSVGAAKEVAGANSPRGSTVKAKDQDPADVTTVGAAGASPSADVNAGASPSASSGSPGGSSAGASSTAEAGSGAGGGSTGATSTTEGSSTTGASTASGASTGGSATGGASTGANATADAGANGHGGSGRGVVSHTRTVRVASVHMPRTGETRYVPNQIFVAVPSTVPPARLEEIRGRLEFDEVGSATLESVGLTYCVWSFQGDRSVAEVAGQLAGEPDLVSVQPNYRFQLSDELSIVPTDPASAGQYALEKLRAVGGLDRPGAEPVNVAVIDTAVDETHPDLAGVVVDRFDAIGSDVPVRSLDHGTAMAGAIAARGQVRGVAPSVHIFSARAFDSDGTGAPLGSSLTIAKAIDWAVRSGARIINLSFAGPRDPALHEILAGAAMKGVVLISAAGNAGPRSPPLYPAADENVIAITATDSEDHVYPMANVGRYVAAAAPGVDVLLPAPNGSYSLETGTSVAAALASGVAALTLERKPDATARDVKSWLTSGARPFATSAKKPLAGAGVIDATATVRAAEP